MQIGEVHEITHNEGLVVKGKLLEMWEDEEFEWFKFDILDNQKYDEFGNPDPNGRYIVDYCQRKEPDYVGIEKHTNMPTQYAGKTRADFNWTFYPDRMAEQQKWIDGFINNYTKFRAGGNGLYIQSRTKGSGKTLLACCIGTEIMRMYGDKLKFINVADYVQKVYDKQAEDFMKATLLILDDIGVQDDSKGNTGSILYDLINYRYGHLPTIFTSNVDIDHCCADPRTTDRVYEMATINIKVPEVPVRRHLADRAKKAFLESIGMER